MTDKTMTLEQVRDRLKKCSKLGNMCDEAIGECADAITRHLSQTAERGVAVAWIDQNGQPCGRVSDEQLEVAFTEAARMVRERSGLEGPPPPALPAELHEALIAVGVPDEWLHFLSDFSPSPSETRNE